LRYVFLVLAVAVLMATTLIATVGSAFAQEDQEPPPGETVTVTFELTVVGQPPPNATFWGYLTFEPFGIRLTDPDGDGVYTRSFDIFPKGDTQPFWIVQGTGTRFSQVSGEQPGEPLTLIKDFGVLTIDQDTTLSASVSFSQEAGRYIVGTSGDDRLLGANGPDLILGLGGNDALAGAYGDDALYGGYGDDLIYGGFLVYGGSDNDALYGGYGDDALYGLSLDDLIYGGYGDDLIRGGFGDGDDALYGGLGSDAIYGDDGDDYLYSAGDDTADLVSGGAGDDLCIVGPEDLLYTSGCEALYVQ
jgi:Ca2+-binding RTX toxin-like protein